MSIQKSAVSIFAILAAVGLTACTVLNQRQTFREPGISESPKIGHAEVKSDSMGLFRQSQPDGSLKQEPLPGSLHSDQGVNQSVSSVNGSGVDDFSKTVGSDSESCGAIFDDNRMAKLPLRERHQFDIIKIFPLGVACRHRMALSVDRAGVVLIWDILAGEARELLKIDSNINKLSFSPKTMLLAVSRGPLVEIYSLEDSLKEASLARLSTNVASMDFHPSGASVLIGGSDSNVFRWKFRKARSFETLRERDKSFERYIGHNAVVSAVAYHPHGRVFFSGDWNGGLIAWFNYDADPFGGKFDQGYFGPRFFTEKATIKGGIRDNSERIDNLLVSEDGQLIVLILENGLVEAWRVRGFKKAGEQKAHQGLIYASALSPDSSKLVTSGRDGLLKVWSIEELLDREKRLGMTLLNEVKMFGLKALTFIDQATILAGNDNGKVFQISVPS